MEQSKTLQNVMIRARGEATRSGSDMRMEHIYLSILRVSQLTAEKIAPSSSERTAIDEEIRLLSRVLESAKIDPVLVGDALRAELDHLPPLTSAQAEKDVQSLLFAGAGSASDRLTAVDVLNAILQKPTDVIKRVNGGGDAPPAPPKRDERGRGEFSATPSNSSVIGAGSQSSHSRSQENAGAAKFVMPQMPDASEFNAAAVTIFDLGDEPSAPMAEEPKKGDSSPSKPDSIINVDDEEIHPLKPPEKKPSGDDESKPDVGEKPSDGGKKPSGKAEGIDLGAAMREIRERRLRGEKPPEDDADTPAKPQIKPEPPKDPTPESQTDIPKKREGVDLGAIMQELRERRIREQRDKKDSGNDSDGDDAESDRGRFSAGTPQKPAAAVTQKPAAAAPQKPAAIPQQNAAPGIGMPQNATPQNVVTFPKPQKVKKTTVFLGRTYHAGIVGSVLLYLLILALSQALILSALYFAMSNLSLSYNGYAFFGTLVISDILILGYCVIRIVPGLLAQKFEPFSLYLDYLLFLLLAAVIVYQVSLTFTYAEWLTVTLKILCGLLAIVHTVRVSKAINRLPNTRGIVRTEKSLGYTLTGSPDKIAFQRMLVFGYVPIVLLTIYWALRRPLDPAASIAIYLFTYAALSSPPKACVFWYDKDDPLCTEKDRKRSDAASLLLIQVNVLSVPALLVFLTILYHWSPVPVWTIILYCVFGLIDIVATIGTLVGDKKV